MVPKRIKNVVILYNASPDMVPVFEPLYDPSKIEPEDLTKNNNVNKTRNKIEQFNAFKYLVDTT